MEFIENVFGLIGDRTWGQSLIPLLVVFGVFITALTGFVQFEFFRRMFRVLSKDKQSADPNVISARAALLISVGGRVGGGNIAGVAVAITLGGPGAVFWMWAIALVGMATSLVECSLAQIYKRRQPDGSFRGGPTRSILHGLGSAPNVAATADVRHPISLGITQSFSVFIDTMFICTFTAFIIQLGDVYVPGAEGVDGIALAQQSLVTPWEVGRNTSCPS